nr:hypothetical protein CFP56_54953 [Quercus suber]
MVVSCPDPRHVLSSSPKQPEISNELFHATSDTTCHAPFPLSLFLDLPLPSRTHFYPITRCPSDFGSFGRHTRSSSSCCYREPQHDKVDGAINEAYTRDHHTSVEPRGCAQAPRPSYRNTQ